jgi:hypothetical protein
MNALKIGMGLACLLGAFFVTQWILDRQAGESGTPQQVQPNTTSTASGDKILALARSTVSDEATLTSAAKSAGLELSPDVKGNVDQIRRIDSGQVQVLGWVLDSKAAGGPLTILLFGDGKNLLRLVSTGSRSDVAAYFKLADSSGKNMGYNGSFACDAGKKLILAVVSPRNLYAPLGPVGCP